MIRIILSALVLATSIITGFAQKLEKEQILVAAGEKLGYINASGIKSDFAGGHGFDAIGVSDIPNDGFVVRNKFKLTKYNDNLEKQWEAEAPKAYSWSCIPDCRTTGNKDVVYFIQISTTPAPFNQFNVARFDKQGKMIQTTFESKGIYDALIATYTTETALHMLVYKADVDTKTVKYTLLTFPSKDLKVKTKVIALETDEYEVTKINKNLYDWRDYLWKNFSVLNNKIVLIKKYPKLVEGTKKQYELVLKTVEVNPDGTFSKINKYDFRAVFEGDIKFLTPSVTLDTLHKELYVFGYCQKESVYDVSGIYTTKFNYTTTEAIYRKELEFSIINQSLPEKSKCKNFYMPATDLSFSKGVYYMDAINQQLRIQINQAKGRGNVKMTEVYLDKYGELKRVDEMLYKNNIENYHYAGFRLIPETVTNLYVSKSSEPIKPTPLDFINSLGKKMDTEYVLVSTITKANSTILVYIRNADGEIKAFKLAN